MFWLVFPQLYLGCLAMFFLSCPNRLTDMIPQCRIRGRIRIGNLEVLHSKTNAIALRRPIPFPKIP
ncbi:hypothetical protein CEN40_17830 [Fischerella thermalis CCMEE 5205]|nr:hypothetical protein CEN40_17830 [Fischerella thermalis CCMEE 5205]